MAPLLGHYPTVIVLLLLLLLLLPRLRRSPSFPEQIKEKDFRRHLDIGFQINGSFSRPFATLTHLEDTFNVVVVLSLLLHKCAIDEYILSDRPFRGHSSNQLHS